jgi:nucleoside-diphosphate-sugar epimerase
LKRIIVTGASGFIGRFVLPMLVDKGWDVHAVYLRGPLPQVNDVSWHKCDLLNRTETESLIRDIAATHCLHLAWYAEPRKFWDSQENFRWLRASLDLMETFHSYGGKRIVTAGTCAEYDWNYGYCNELVTPTIPVTLYGVCKDALRRVMEAYGSAYGLQVAWGRVFHLFGPHEAPGRLVPYVMESLSRGDEARCSLGNQIRDFLFVEDVAAAFVCLINADTVGCFNIGSSQPVRVRELVEMVARAVGRLDLLRFGALKELPDEAPFIVSDNRRLAALGWKQHYSLSEGIGHTVHWWKEKSTMVSH